MTNLLMADVFTFLTFLHTSDVAPRGIRRLPPTALVTLDRQLAVPDRIKSPRLARRGGKRGPTELETQRIRFIHFLCEASGLVALTGRYLKPTLHVAPWLAATPDKRAAKLFEAAFPPGGDRACDALWRAYRLPGCELRSPTYALAQLLDLLRQMRREERLKLTTIRRLAPLAVPDPDAVWRGVLGCLEWFGAVEWCERRSAVRLTEVGARLLRREDAAPPASPPTSLPLRFSLHAGQGMEIIAPPQADWRVLYELADYAGLVAVKPRRRYRLEAGRVRRAMERGASLHHLGEFLAAATGKALPPAVSDWLTEQARQAGRVRLSRVTLLEVADPDLLTELTREQPIRAGIARTLSPRAVVVREHHLPLLLRRLERRGLAPRVEFPLLSEGKRARDEGRSRRLFDRPSRAHEYLALRLGYELSDLILPAYRAPYSLLLDLEQQLSPHDRDVAVQIAGECAQNILHPPQPLPPSIEDRLPVPASETLAQIERAIHAGAPLEIVYYSPYRDEVTTRAVEPHRIEWRGKTPYLIARAACQLDQDERTFRVGGKLRAAIETPRSQSFFLHFSAFSAPLRCNTGLSTLDGETSQFSECWNRGFSRNPSKGSHHSEFPGAPRIASLT